MTAREAAATGGRHGGANALLYTVLGELVLPAGGSVWTSSIVAVFDALDVAEKSARQALARVGERGVIAATRHGREARWSLTPGGRRLLERGAERIYGFGAAPVPWGGEWLVAHCPVPEAQRAVRHRLRTQLAFAGFGHLSASLAVSPHPEREPVLRGVLADLGLSGDAVILRSRTGSVDDDVDLARRAWSLEALAASYEAFVDEFGRREAGTPEAEACALVELVHEWRRFPFADPELPTELLPAGWAGHAAAAVFRERRERWGQGAASWFAELEARA